MKLLVLVFALATLTDARSGRKKKFDADAVLRASGCCKVCKKGRPCGDSCIARTSQCNRGFGCACSTTGGNGFSDTLMAKGKGAFAHAALKDAYSSAGLMDEWGEL